MLSLAKTQDVSRSEHDPNQQLIHVNDLVEQVVRHLYPMARAKHIDLGAEMSEIHPLVIGNEWMVREAIINILDNAISYSPEHQSVTIMTGEKDQEVFIRVQDSGPGLSAEDIEMVGKRFWRSEATKDNKGAGLGLAIVQSIMKWHQGRLEITSCLEQCGLNVTLWFNKPARENPGEGFKLSN
jgi:two-component system sensor histidine kinase TctE